MNLVVADFETFYSREYSLSKLTTEAYVRDPRFHVHGVGLKFNDAPAYYVPDVAHIGERFRQIDWSNTALLCHNTMFDAFILSERYGIRPRFLLDTLSMARALYQHESGALSNMAKLVLGREKGVELANFLGVERLTREQQEVMERYCVNDVELTYDLFQKLKVGFPIPELRVIDLTLRMFTEPIMVLDRRTLVPHLRQVRNKRRRLIKSIPYGLKALRSNDQFAALLRTYDVEPPLKTSLTTGKQTYAFAKTDEGMTALLEHEDERVQALATARLGVKSSIEETRTQMFMEMQTRGALPVPLAYFGAGNTGRWSGMDKCNFQNLPRGGALRKAIMAPPEYKLVVADFAQIEARMLAWLAGQDDLTADFAAKKDVYCEMASRIFGRPITKVDRLERQLGKVVVLGAGYSMSWKKFSSLLASGPLGAPPILFDYAMSQQMGVALFEEWEDEGQTLRAPIVMPSDAKQCTTKLRGADLLAHATISKFLIDTYRGVNDRIVQYWRTCDKIIVAMNRGVRQQFGPIETDSCCIWLPNGLRLQYKNLRRNEDDDGWTYIGKRGAKQYIYGGKLCENIDQALSRIVMSEAMATIGARYKIVLTVHDELVVCVPDAEAEEALAFMLEVMRTPPAWAPGLPLDAEGDIAQRYGEAK
jgi:DNA polymerase